MTIYISTGGYKKKSADQITEDFINNNIKEIELSGGIYDPNLINNLTKYLSKGAKFEIHNYFPPPEKPFIINLASNEDDIRKLSLNHVFKAIKCCEKLRAKSYSFHAGFLCDFDISEIGKKIKKRPLYEKKRSTDLFLECLNQISKFARDHGVNIMVENNVISKKNLLEFNKNPFLMCDPQETFEIMNRKGILAVEMEAAGLYGVAAEYGADALAVATVSDVISKNLQMSSEEREIGLKTMVEITLDSL